MYKRILNPAKSTFFLFGPRGTGKSTWIEQQFLDVALNINLLSSSAYLKYKRNPSILAEEVATLKKGAWIVIDEVQKLPELLDEVQSILFEHKNAINFLLTGSSARKLKKSEANMLAGRALTRNMFPLSMIETKNRFKLDQALSFGMLPAVQNQDTDADRIEFLDAYVVTYLKEEIQQEALVRNLDSFYRFLQVSALTHGQVLNISNIARDVGVSRSTVQGYFEILTDTLIGWYLPALKLKAKIKEVNHPKFFFFDNGVQRALLGEHRNPVDKIQAGHLFEAFILNEIRLLTSYLGIGADMSYWRTEAGNEVDLVWSRGSRRIGIEIKNCDYWKSDYNFGLETLLKEGKIKKAYGIYNGTRALKKDGIWIFPYKEALEKIHSQEIGFEFSVANDPV